MCMLVFCQPVHENKIEARTRHELRALGNSAIRNSGSSDEILNFKIVDCLKVYKHEHIRISLDIPALSTPLYSSNSSFTESKYYIPVLEVVQSHLQNSRSDIYLSSLMVENFKYCVCVAN